MMLGAQEHDVQHPSTDAERKAIRTRRAPGHASLALLLAFTLLLPFSDPAHAVDHADRALEAVRALIASGDLAPNSVLRLGFKQGNVNAYLGNNLELQREWERQTGTVIEIQQIPQLPVKDVLMQSTTLDLTVARNHEFPELLPLGLAEDLTPLFEKFGFTLDDDPTSGYIRPDLQAYLGERIAAIPADGDPAVLYLRRDLMEDPKEQAAFRKATGRDLVVPDTWEQYEELLRFFHRPEQGLYGALEERDPEGAWMYWLPRYLSTARPYQPLFDAQMRPLLDTPQGIAATENYLATIRYSPAGITTPGNNYSFTLPLYMQGKGFATISTIAGVKLFNGESSPIRGRFMITPIPGRLVGGELVRTNTIIYGNNLVIPKNAANRELAFLYAMWVTSPEVSPRSVGVRGGFTDPYRWNHLGDPRIRSIYTDDALRVFADAWKFTLPPGTGIPGDSDYLNALDANLTAAARGEFSAAEAMRRTAAAWEEITERLGRTSQMAHWKAFQSNYGVGP